MADNDIAITAGVLARFGITPSDAELVTLNGLRAAASMTTAALDRVRPTRGITAWPTDLTATDPNTAVPRLPTSDGSSWPDVAGPTGPLRSLAAVIDQLQRGQITSAALVDELLARADAVDGDLGAFVARFDDTARAAAAHADAQRTAGDPRPLLGVPIAVKDLVATVEGPTTAQSRVVAFDHGFDAECVRRLRDAGAIVLGKTSLNEHAMGRVDPNGPYSVPRHPWQLDRWPGGSSSGSASGIAAGLFPAAIGTDTGGSIRIPASFCGVTGFKPTYGVIDTDGVAPLSWSTDTVGPMGATAVDCTLLLRVLARNAGLLTEAPAAYARGDLRGVRLAFDTSWRSAEGLHPDVVTHFEAACARLIGMGARLRPIDLTASEIAGVANGVAQSVEVFEHHRPALAERWSDYGPGVRTFLAMGAFFDGATYVRAQRVRSDHAALLTEALSDVDAVVSPTVGLVAPLVTADHAALIPLFFTKLWNAVGFPALSVPMATSVASSETPALPLGLQFAGLPHTDLTVLALGAAFQSTVALPL